MSIIRVVVMRQLVLFPPIDLPSSYMTSQHGGQPVNLAAFGRQHYLTNID
jgi:hypothetical protein